MKVVASIVMAVVFLIGCGKTDDDLSPMMDLRQGMEQGGGCSFSLEVTADYGDRSYTFVIECGTDDTENLHFELLEPDTVAGIRGSISQSGGKLKFEDQVLLFAPLTQGQLTPAIAPWLMYEAITGGYIQGVTRDGEQLVYTINDTFASEELTVLLTLQKNSRPSYCEIFWNNRRILTMNITAFEDL